MSAPQLLTSSSFKTSIKTLASRREFGASKDDSAAPYVLNIASLPSHYAIATSSPANLINILDKNTLNFVQSLGTLSSNDFGGSNQRGHPSGSMSGSGTKQAHEGGVTGLKTFDYFLGEKKSGLISSGKDGRVVIWDDRTVNGEGGVKMYASASGYKFRSVLSCDIASDGMTVVGGTELQGNDAILVYWDPRNPNTPLRTHSATHSDDITVVSFAPPGVSIKTPADSLPSTPVMSTSAPQLLLSASSDGLLSISNANEDDEEEAMLLTANWGCSIAQAGWIADKGVWAASDMETFSTWGVDLDPRLSFNIREPSVHGQHTWVTDYLVTSSSNTQQQRKRPLLGIFVGSNEGDVSLISTKNPLASSKSKSQKRNKTQTQGQAFAPWKLHTTWAQGHVGVVRSLLHDEQRGVIVTGGEDSKLHIWKDETLFSEDDLYEEEEDEGDMDMDDAGGDEMMVSPGASPQQAANWRKRDLDLDGDDTMGEKEGKRRRQ